MWFASQPSGIDKKKLATIGMIASRMWFSVSERDEIEVGQCPAHLAEPPEPGAPGRAGVQDADRAAVTVDDQRQATVPAALLQEQIPSSPVGSDEAGHEGVGGIGEDLGRGARLGDDPTF